MRSKFFRMMPLFLIAALLASMLIGCTSNQQEGQAETRTVVDMAGRSVTLSADVQRIIIVYPPATAMVFAIDGADHLVGIDSGTSNSEILKAIEPKFKDMTNVGHQFRGVNAEELLALAPDVQSAVQPIRGCFAIRWSALISWESLPLPVSERQWQYCFHSTQV
jgi:ABC-type hemin transport system substrate-binding protein